MRRVFYGWVIVAAAIGMVGVASGTLSSLAVFLRPMQDSMGWSRGEISGVALWMSTTDGIGTLLWGTLSDRWGTRRVALVGGALLGLGLVVTSRITSLWQLYATIGGVVGLATGAFYAPLTTTTTHWFRARRGLAVALVSAGTGVGTFVIAPFTRWLISTYDWRVAMLVLGDVVWLVLIPLAVLVKEAPAATAGTTEPSVPLPEIWRSPQFWLIALTHFACCVAHSGPIFHMVTNAMDHGVPGMTAATILGVSGLASLLGRVVSGVMADRWGAKYTLVAMLSVQAPAILAYLFTGGALSFYVLAVVFGGSYGAVMPMYALLTREYFGAKAMGTAYGAIFMLQAIGMGLGAFGGGWAYDHLGTYTWLFSFAAVVGAIAILLALPLRSHRAPRVAAAVA